MKTEGALKMRFLRHGGIYRPDVVITSDKPGPGSRFPVGSGPGYRTRRKAHALPIARDEFRPAIPPSGCSPAEPDVRFTGTLSI